METQWNTTTQILDGLQGSNYSDAWLQFRDTFYPIVCRFARSFGLSFASAEDATQEVMMTFLKKFRGGHYDPEKGRLRNWLFGIAKRVILNYCRRLPRESLIPDETQGTSFWESLPKDDSMRKTWNVVWQQTILEKCFSQARVETDEKVFKAFELYGIHGVPVEEVARRLDMSKNAVYIAKSRVLNRLRQLRERFEQ